MEHIKPRRDIDVSSNVGQGWATLSHDLLFAVASQLSTTTRVRARCVCRSWRDALRNYSPVWGEIELHVPSPSPASLPSLRKFLLHCSCFTVGLCLVRSTPLNTEFEGSQPWSKLRSLQWNDSGPIPHTFTAPQLSSLEVRGGASGPVNLPAILRLTSLRHLTLECCQDSHHHLNDISGMVELRTLVVDAPRTCLLTDSVTSLTQLQCLAVTGLRHLPDSLGKLVSLTSLECGYVHRLPVSVTALTALRKFEFCVDWDGEHITQALAGMQQLTSLECTVLQGPLQLPSSPRCLSRLRALNISGELRCLPPVLQALTSLTALTLVAWQLRGLPAQLGKLSGLRQLDVHGAELGDVSGSVSRLVQLTSLELCSDGALRLPVSISNLMQLVTVSLKGDALDCPLGSLSGLETLSLSSGASMAAGPDMGVQSGWMQLTRLYLQGSAVQCLQGALASLPMLLFLHLEHAYHISALDTITTMTSLRELTIMHAPQLTHLPCGISGLVNLRHLLLSECDSLTRLPQTISALSLLQRLEVTCCDRLALLTERVGALQSLLRLCLMDCAALEALPADMSQLGQLEELDLYGCTSLRCLPEGLETLAGLRAIDVGGCSEGLVLPEGLPFTLLPLAAP